MKLMWLLTALNVSPSQFTRGTKVDSDKFALDKKMKGVCLVRHLSKNRAERDTEESYGDVQLGLRGRSASQ